MGWILFGGYLGIIVLMAMESSIFPVPSEIVVPPAAFLAVAQANGQFQEYAHFTLVGVVLAGTFGSWLGSAITYGAARAAGRPFVNRYGRFFLMPPEKVARAEVWLRRYEAGGVFFARLLPVIRHLISIPAGLVRMPFGLFSMMTTLGAAIWCAVLAYFGALAFKAQPDLLTNPEGLTKFIKGYSHWIVLGVVVLAALYFVVLRLSASKTVSATTTRG